MAIKPVEYQTIWIARVEGSSVEETLTAKLNEQGALGWSLSTVAVVWEKGLYAIFIRDLG